MNIDEAIKNLEFHNRNGELSHHKDDVEAIMRIHTTRFVDIYYSENERVKAQKRIKTYEKRGYTIESPESDSGDKDSPFCVQLMNTRIGKNE